MSALGQKRTWLHSKPRYREIDTCDHRHWGNDQRTQSPEPTQTIWQKRRNEADNESTDCGGSGPSVPIHFGCEEIQNGVGKIPGTVCAQEHDALRGIDGKKREPSCPRNDIEERKRRPKGEREA